MYHCQLHFILVGLAEEAGSIISRMEPLSRFSHEMERFASLGDVPREKEIRKNTIVIVEDSAGAGGAQLRKQFGREARLILCTGRADSLAEEELAEFEEIWPSPLTKRLARYEFALLQEKIRLEKDGAFRQQCLDTLIDMMPDLIWFKDLPGCHLKVNQAFCEAVGKTREDVTGKFHTYIWGTSEDDAEHGEQVCYESEVAVAKARRTCYFEEEVRHARRGICQLKVLKTPLYDEDGEVVGTVGAARDVTREKEDQEKILHLARTDALTGLANRRYFYEYIEENRNGQGMTICYIDLDHFKQLNDTFGHHSGDAALLGVAELLRRSFPKDFITRLGGDEFVVAIIGKFSRDQIMERLDGLMAAAKDFFQMDECLMGLSMSIGVALAENADTSLELLVQQSDEALYYSKNHGKNMYSFHEDIPSKQPSGA